MNFTENDRISDEIGEHEYNTTVDDNLFTNTENFIFGENGFITNSDQLFFGLPEMLCDLIYTEKCSKCDEFRESAIRFKKALRSLTSLSYQLQNENLNLKRRINKLEHQLTKQKESRKAFETCTEQFSNCKIVDCPFCLPFPTEAHRSNVTLAVPTSVPPSSNLQPVKPNDKIAQSSLPQSSLSSSSVPFTSESSSVSSIHKSSAPSANNISSFSKQPVCNSTSPQVTKNSKTAVPLSSPPSSSPSQVVPMKLQCFHGIKNLKNKLCLCRARFSTKIQLYTHLKLIIAVESHGIEHNLVCEFCNNKKFRSLASYKVHMKKQHKLEFYRRVYK